MKDNIQKAIEENDIYEVQRLITAGLDINSPQGVNLPLRVAVGCNKIDMVRILLESGAYPYNHVLLELQYEALTKADAIHILVALIDAGINVDFRLEGGKTLLMHVASRGLINAAKLLIYAGSDANLMDKDGDYALSISATSGQKQMYDYLWKHTSPLLRNQTDELLSEGVILRNRRENVLLEQLMIYAATGNLEGLMEVVDQGIDVNGYGENKNTALGIAAYWGHVEVVKALIRIGADVNLCDEDRGLTPLAAAATNTNFNIHPLLSEVNVGDQVEVVRVLIEAGADVNTQDRDGWSAILGASNAGSIQAVKYLLDAGADINASNSKGETALMRAKEQKFTEIVKLLTNAGI